MADLKAARVERALEDLFRALEARPVPEHVQRIVDLLEGGQPDGRPLDAEPRPSPSRLQPPAP